MKSANYLLLSLLLVSTAGLAQNDEYIPIVVMGKVIDKESKKPVEAKIKYESLPYGSKIGLFTGSEFNFSMDQEKEYSLMVSSDGYVSNQKNVTATNGQDTLEVVIELQSTGVNKIIRLENLIFSLGKSEITPESFSELDELALRMELNPNMEIQLEGHTDYRGDPKSNMKLSEDRVEAVKKYLVKKGVDKRRIKTKAFGGSQPLSRGNDAESRRLNRRVEVRILAI